MSEVRSRAVVLESGDRLTRVEFHRRYCLRPDIKKAELIQGVVYVPSPLRSEQHGEPHSLADFWLGAYAALTPGVTVSIDATVYLSADDEVQPDLALFRLPADGTPVQRTPEGYLEGAPELVVEIAASSASYDLHDKLESYRRAGVLEYIVWRTLDRALDWFRLDGDRYLKVEPDAAGLLESRVFAGLRLAVPALLAGDRAALLAALTAPGSR